MSVKRRIAGNGASDFLQDVFALCVFHRHAEQDGQCGEDFPIRAAFSDRLNRRTNGLHMSFGICKRPGFFHRRSGRQHNVGQEAVSVKNSSWQTRRSNFRNESSARIGAGRLATGFSPP